ncbi:MAG: fasciclin domain-containing protein [Gemmatimonadota bacterium]|nr:MAG: fasciclin domain-containing protein [Gemmatimonadota bacterium]
MLTGRSATLAALVFATTALMACDQPVEPTTPATQLSRTPKNNAQPSIVEIAVGNDNFETLVAAVVAADLVDVLNGKQHFTVFAPTDDAFAALGLDPDNVGDLPVDVLTDILLYHVTRGDRLSQSVVGAKQIRMVNGDLLFVEGTTLVTPSNSANLILDLIDIDARNGVIHVIDSVLLP